ncbi:AraC-like DNA-binding protein [Aquimarina sp. EL_43]|uniref:helix-turn-helix domain-containing protein n=1 Tax=unclassified Aquimarina TaxID=2627091 RepID=UPI0018CB0187|nr:helix-turn-helix domain-containing protein [Aquimarina sp. EL_35]MBG6132321.1 AraC-like DNA-binding protein [Aquimarina sp. EL_35]MBG6152452.1 AraC-like DNA-binding protein [Aquimarina sp. EL_32]MBG6170621.1 AraC-like DNA-binding protein [Aquimarina sp. EL_43]
MRLTQRRTILTYLFFIFILFIPLKGYCFIIETSERNEDGTSYKLLFSKDQFSNGADFVYITEADQAIVGEKIADSTAIFKELAFSYAKIDQPKLACEFIEKYIKSTLDVTFVDHSNFDQISTSESYKQLAEKYLKQFGWFALFCFYISFVGFFITIVLNFRKGTDKAASLLMSIFVLLNSCFMAHLGLYFMNYEYYWPHTLFMFSTFGLLYGPIIYFYFKRASQNYKFKRLDLLHLIPTIFLVILLLPVYLLPAEEKLRMVINYERPYLTLISVSKLLSLLIYGVLMVNVYVRRDKKRLYFSKQLLNWQRNIMVFCAVYVLSYAIYAFLNVLHLGSGFLFNVQVVSLAVMVLYISYSAFVQPSLFGKLRIVKSEDEKEEKILKNKNSKYEKSGLTPSLSLELKVKLLYLLKEEKIYKQNDITLHKVSLLLDTTRHNTSQIINEHFGLNFFELINKYRIEEAKEILKGEKYKGFNIIDVAYEVGFNNKVTFNKSFKKYNQITPSEYLKRFVA